MSGGMNVGLNILLLPRFGIIGAAVTTLASFLFTFITTLYYSRGTMTFDIDARFIFKSICASLAMTVVILGLEFGSKFNALVAASTGAIVYIVLIFLMKGFDKAELSFITQLFKNALGR